MAKKVAAKKAVAKRGPRPGSPRINPIDVASKWNDKAKVAEKEAERLAEEFRTDVSTIKRHLKTEWSGSQYRETFETTGKSDFPFKDNPEGFCAELNRDGKIKETHERLDIDYQTMMFWLKKWKREGVIGNPWVVLKK